MPVGSARAAATPPLHQQLPWVTVLLHDVKEVNKRTPCLACQSQCKQIADQLEEERERHRRPWFMVDPEGPLRHAWLVIPQLVETNCSAVLLLQCS